MKNLWLTAAALLIAPLAASGADYVTIKGSVVLKNPPKPEVVNVNADKEACCKDGDLYSNKIEVSKAGGLKNVVVWLRPVSEDRNATFPADKIHPDLKKVASKEHIIDQPKCQFEPRVVAARAGDTLLIKNTASINHNINYNSNLESFNVTLPPNKDYKLKSPLEAQRTPILFKCDIHGWMEGRVRVFDHPYFATTDKDGNFEMKQVPVGKWSIVYWHEGGFHKGKDGILGFPIEVAGEKNNTMELKPLDFEFPK